MWNEEYLRDPHAPCRSEAISQTYNPWEASTYKFLDRPLLDPHRRSEVAIARAHTYRRGMGEDAVEEVIFLLGGIKRFCKPGDKVLIKTNAGGPAPEDMWHDTTHPSIVRALVRLLTEYGAEVWIGESGAWEMDPDDAGIWKCFGYDKIAEEFGAKLKNFRREEQIKVKVPDPRFRDEVYLAKSMVDCDVFMMTPSLKNCFVLGDSGMTVVVKGMFGCMLPLQDRLVCHKNALTASYAGCDYIKAIGVDKFKLTLVDGIATMDGAIHVGNRSNPGIVLASHDFVAVEAACYYLSGYEWMENPTVQVPMKQGLGTGDPREIRILGERLEDVRYKVMPGYSRYVQPYMNVHEYLGGGVCSSCVRASMFLPSVPDKNKLYAVVAGNRLEIPDNFEQYDEVYLVGICANSEQHQLPKFMEKIQKAKKVVKEVFCGFDFSHKNGKGGVYDNAWFPLPMDLLTASRLPMAVSTMTLTNMEDRREGRETEVKGIPSFLATRSREEE